MTCLELSLNGNNTIVFINVELNLKVAYIVKRAHDVITRHAVIKVSGQDVSSRLAVAQVSLNICKLCLKFLRELSEPPNSITHGVNE